MNVQLINLLVLVAIVNGVYSLVKLDVQKLLKSKDGSNNPLTNPKKEFRIAVASVNAGLHRYLGYLIYDSSSQEMEVKFDSEEKIAPVYSEYGNKNGQENTILLSGSELTYYKGKLYAADHATGRLYLYKKGKFESWMKVPREMTTGLNGVMPIAWATAQGDVLYVGPNGNDGFNYVAEILGVESGALIELTDQFDALKEVAGMKNGYLIHESCVYSEIHNEFYFLPKTGSRTVYEEEADLRNAANILLTMNKRMNLCENVAEIQHSTVHKDRGYSSFTFVPGTEDEVIVALQTSDITNSTYITAFTRQGKVVLNSMKIWNIPLKGLAFL